ncbi:MAG: hypothetical protein IPG89_20670 [Bacteroidetes bacterium]|nr:hypothetical protein [Bacteroidota bacterium]
MPEHTVDDTLSFGTKNSLKHLVDAKEESVVFYLDGVLSGEEKLAFRNSIKKDESLQALVKQYETLSWSLKQLLFQWQQVVVWFSERRRNNFLFKGLLTQNESNKILVKAQADEVLMKELQTYKAAKTHSDLSIVYPNKEELKKSAIIVFLRSNVSYLSIAASLFTFSGFFRATSYKFHHLHLRVKNSFQLRM